MTCPNFSCLLSDKTNCDKHDGCSGCSQYGDCGVCRNQSAIVAGQAVPCELISLPLPCRSCALRGQDDFDPDTACRDCFLPSHAP